MDHLEQRFMVYSALLILCGTLSIFVGPTAGMWSFLLVASVVEIIYWITFDSGEDSAHSS